MKLFYTSIALLLLSSAATKAQVVLDTVADNYPDYVIQKVQDVVLAANVASTEQLPLANFFMTEAATIDSASINNATPSQIGTLQANLITQFQAILSSQELALYSTNRPNSIYATPPPITTSGQ